MSKNLINYFKRLYFLILISVIFIKCTSVAKYNQQISQPIAPHKVIEDIDYTQHQLEKLYPNLYGYISKEKLTAKFDSVRNTVTKPMTSNELFMALSPTIAAVRQGHLTLNLVSKKYTKKEQKNFKKAGVGPLSQFVFEYIDGKMYVIANNSKEKMIKTGDEVLSINQLIPQEIYAKYHKTFTSDGFNTTYLRKAFIKRFPLYFVNEIGIKDSLTYVYKQNDSIKTEVIRRIKPDKKTKVKPVNTVAVVAPKIDKTKIKAEKKHKKIYGYDELTKEYAKSFSFPKTDSTVAVLKIKSFNKGRYDVVYKTFFDSIKTKKTKNLIIDVRDNPGGKISDVVDLYSYLTDSSYVLLHDPTLTKRTSLWHAKILSNVPKYLYPIAVPLYPVYMGISYGQVTKNADGSLSTPISGSRKKDCNENNFKGKIYVLINGGSFSASCILSTALKSNKNVTFVGEETGGAFNGCTAGAMPVVFLPNSKLPLRLGLLDIENVNQNKENFGRGIFPDKEIIETIDDKINKKDPEMEWILNDIKTSEKNKKKI